jgi:hypothetical protein
LSLRLNGGERRGCHMQKSLLLEYLDCRRLPVAECAGAVGLHGALCKSAPEFYMYLLADPATEVSQKREIFVNLLGHEAAQGIERARILAVLRLLPVDEALKVIGVVRDLRINRSRAREMVLAFLLGHEQFPVLAAIKRQRLAHLLKHVLGERTWSAIKRALASTTPEGEAFLQREVLRYAWDGDVARTREVLCFLTGVPFEATHPDLTKSLAARQDLEQGKGLPDQTLLGIRGIFQKRVPVRRVRQLSATVSEVTHADGPLTTLYKEEFLTRPAATLSSADGETTRTDDPFAQAFKVFKALFEQPAAEKGHVAFGLDVSEQIQQAAESLPRIEGRVAVVLDLSASMVSSGERLYHPASLALALTCLLQTCIRDVLLYQAGDVAAFEQEALLLPQGATDLATAIIEAASQQPQAILVITDGYENRRQGDAEQVVRGLQRIGLTFPVYQIVPLFAATEKLSQRRLGKEMPVVAIAHEDGVRELLMRVILTSEGENVSAREMEQLQQLLIAR